MHLRISIPLLGGLLLAGAAAPALSSTPPFPIDQLEAFYEAMNGDSWYRNDNWLDKDIPPCDWYGIRCPASLSPPTITSIGLRDNNLIGNLDDVADVLIDLVEPATGSFIDLGHNHIIGSLPQTLLLSDVERLILRHNQISGELPDVTPAPGNMHLDLSHNKLQGQVPDGLMEGTLEDLNLSNNNLSGPLPDITPHETGLRSLALSGNRIEGPLDALARHTELRWLNLSDNRFEGPFPGPLLALEELSGLNLSGNDFSGPLPSELTDLERIWPNAHSLGGIDLCWNDFEVNDEALDQWLREYHVGVEYERCFGVQRQPLDVTVSGSWFQPSRSGEGSTLQLLDNGDALIYWFTYTRFGNQMWLFGTVSEPDLDGPTIAFSTLYRPEGFPTTDGSMVFDLVRRGQWRYDRRIDGRLAGLQVYDINISTSGFEPQPVGLRVDHTPLSRINGTRCDDDPKLPDISGVWHNPDHDMDGFLVEMMASGQVLVYWFTWVPDTTLQAWMMGVGDLAGDGHVIIDELHRPTGTRFGDDFDPEEITRPVWGQLELAFDDDDTGHAWWTSESEDWESGDRALERLTRPMLPECD